ncbi:MAG: small conductance mechanosensitive channel [Moritella sp.]|jgi:small conductance mechanosensitive channel
MEYLEQLLAQAPELATVYGTKILLALVIFTLGKYLANITRSLSAALMEKRKIDHTVVSFVSNMVWSIVFAFTIVATLSQFGVQTASLVAVIGAAGLAIGLALQGSLSNFAAGVLIVIFRPCRIGDYIEAAGVAGTVDEITIFSTRLITPDNKVIIAPNSAIMDGTITNYSALGKRRLDLVIGVSYDADIKLTKQILARVVADNTFTLKDPEPIIGILELADSSVNFAVRPWVKTSDYWGAYFAMQEELKLALDNAGIGIPYPQVDLHVQGNPATAVNRLIAQ